MKRTLPPIPADRPIFPAPPPPDEGVAAWNMNTSCNYRCSYCTQRFLDDRGRWARDVPAFLAGFASLPARTGVPWEVKLSGGEPLVHPRIVEVAAGLAEAGLFVSLVTNFSRPAVLDDVVGAIGPQLRVVSLSLHLEFAEVEAFVAAASRLQARLPVGASLVSTVVAQRARLASLPALVERFAAAGLRLKVQPEKQDREIIDYDGPERAALLALGGHNGLGQIAHDFGGQPCWSGARSLIVDDRGEVFRCYPARRYRVEAMGNLLDGTLLLQPGPSPCLYRSCNCTVPIARGMMPLAAVVDRLQPPSEGVTQ